MTERPPFPHIIDSTMRAAFVDCPQKFQWEFIRCIGPKSVSIHLHFGACFAKGLDTFRKVFYFSATPDSYQEFHHRALGAALEAIILEWGDYPPDTQEPKTLWHCLALLDYYFDIHPPFTDSIQPVKKADGTPAVEFSFAVPLDIIHPETGDPLLYAGRFDMLGIHDTGVMLVDDEKTTSQMGPTWSKSWDLRAQFPGYVWASRRYGHPVAGALVRGLGVLKTMFKSEDVLVLLSDWQLERWHAQLLRDIQRMIRRWEEGYWDYNLDSACTSYGGCAFRDLCLSPTPERWIDASYAPRHWDPLARDPLREDRMRERPMLGILLDEE